MTERWLPVGGYEGLYEVSDAGRVRSLGRFYSPGWPGSKPRWLEGRILRQAPTQGRYLTVALSRDAKPRTFPIHHLVLTAFAGPRPESGMHACHNNGIGTDNRLDNLRWDTPAANVNDQIRHGTQVSARKTHCPQGHEYSVENTYIHVKKAGGAARMCRTCQRNRQLQKPKKGKAA